MSSVIGWIAAQAEKTQYKPILPARLRDSLHAEQGGPVDPAEIVAHQFPSETVPLDTGVTAEQDANYWQHEELDAGDRERRVYRGRTVAMLRRYLRYAMETGRLPSLLGREFFRTRVTSYSVSTFEDRVIFVHDMEMCLNRLDEFSQQLIARNILQEHDRWATARLLHCNEKTVRRLVPMALDQLSEILLDMGLMERANSIRQNSCQGGIDDEISVSDCEDSENKF